MESAFRLADLNRHKLIALTNYGSERELLLSSEEAHGTLQRLQDIFARWASEKDTALVRLLADETLFYNGFVLNEMAGIRQRMYRDTLNRDLFDALNKAKAQWLAVQLYMGDADPSVPVLRFRVDSLEKELVRASRAYAGFRQPWTSSDAIRALRPGEAMLVFTGMDRPAVPAPGRQLAAFLFRSDDPRPRYIELCRVPVPDSLQAGVLADGLHAETRLVMDSVWGKIDPHLAGIGRVLYVPAGILHRANLAALPLQDGSLMMEHRSFVRLLNARHMPAQDPREKGPADAFIAGGIDYDAPSEGASATLPPDDAVSMRGAPWTEQGTAIKAWPPLPGTAAEAEVVARLLAASQCAPTMLDGRAATEEAFHMLGRSGANPKSPDILHLATHGYFLPLSDSVNLRPFAVPSVVSNVRDPMVRSGILLAGANTAWTGAQVLPPARDGIVTAYEISRLDLADTRIVVLSACETGLGDITEGEGVMGLQRAFRIAGVDKILMSLWKVPDAATAYLMGQFYRHWIEGGHSPGQALEQAQLHMRDAGFPYTHWAGFVLAE
jgi:CHAT domain-containing protein